jgi:NitT/TauT family transport system substrate-binding protein
VARSPRTIRLGEPFRGLLYVPFYLAEALGAYNSEGVPVQVQPAPSPAASAEALLAGALDAVWGGPMRVLHHYDRDPGCGLVLFAEAVTRDPFFVVGRTPRPDFRLPALAGLRVGTVAEVPTPWLCLQDDLRRAGCDPAALERVADASMADNADALRAGALDAAQLLQPHVEALLAEGAGHLWYAAATRGPTAYTSYYTTRPLLARRDDAWYRMTRALTRVLGWLGAQPAAEVAAAVRPWFRDVPPPHLEGAVARYQALGVWSRQPVLSPEGFARLQASLLSGGFIARETPYDVCVDTRLARTVLAEAPPPL